MNKNSKFLNLNSKFSLTIGWLYPEHMSTYGDRGNVICLEKRCLWREIQTKITRIQFRSKNKALEDCDLILGGGAQDRQQELVLEDLKKKKDSLVNMFNNNIPGLFVCGSPQLLGHWYMTGDGKKLNGLGIFDFVTRHFGNDKPRCIGNTTGEILINISQYSRKPQKHLGWWRGNDIDSSRRRHSLWRSTAEVKESRNTIVGFENHGGRTYLSRNAKPFARVKRGFGNNGEDGTEGAVYKNVIACYYHGPFLPKNPHIADWLIQTALEVKYRKDIQLEPLDDTLEWQAHENILKKTGV